MTEDDALHRFRLRVFGLAHELGSVRAACRVMGIHHSTYYGWQHQLIRFGPEMLRPRERRRPRMPNAIRPLIEQRVVAFALGHPGFGPVRISAELARPLWGGLGISPNGVWRVLRRHGLSTRAKRLGLIAGYAAPAGPERPEPAPERHIVADHPGELVQLDCFRVGRCWHGGVGGTPPSRSRRRSPGRSCMPRPATPRPGIRAPSHDGWRQTSPAGAGASNG